MISYYPLIRPPHETHVGFFLGQDSVARPGMAGGLDGGGKVRGGVGLKVFFFLPGQMWWWGEMESQEKDGIFFMDFPY